MNTLVEKMFGIIMFLAIFVPFQLGLYSSYMDAWEFTQVTTEFTQLVKEEGKYTTTGRAGKFYGNITKTTPNDLFDRGYRISIKNNRTGLTSIVDNLEKEDKNVDAQFGDVLTITYTKNETVAYNWKPDLKKVTNVTVYKR